MTSNEYFVTHSCGHCICDSISIENSDGSFENLTYQDIVDLLNLKDKQIEELKQDNFHFTATEDYNEINKNKLEVYDRHTRILMDGKRIAIRLTPDNWEPFEFLYHITGVTFKNPPHFVEEFFGE